RMFAVSLFFAYITATSDFSTLSLHDALPIYLMLAADLCVASDDAVFGYVDIRFGSGVVSMFLPWVVGARKAKELLFTGEDRIPADRKSTRLNSSHVSISYAVFCLKKKTRSKL